MKKLTKIFALVLALAMMLMTGCGQKTYATAEEWYTANPLAASFMEAAIAAEVGGDQMTFAITGNTVIYGMEMEEEIFGQSEELDATYKEYFDTAFEGESATYTQIITELSELCGVPASDLSVRIEIFNPDASEPGYTKTFTAQ